LYLNFITLDTKHIKIEDYNYPLPDERIAKFPISRRDQSKLLIYNKGSISQDVFYHLPNYLPSDTLLVFNNTRVIQARLHFRKKTGALIEVFLLEPAVPTDYEQIFQARSHCSWYCIIGNLKKWKEGDLQKIMDIHGKEITLTVRRQEMHQTSYKVDFEWNDNSISFAEIIDAVGELPIPPYLNRNTEESDKITYQTVYSKIKGSVAAPTAGLHFTQEVLDAIDQKQIIREEITLHVGAGTFKPVKSKEIEGHMMHTEFFSVKKTTIEKLIQYHASAIAVGTTSVRTLESLYYIGCKLANNPEYSSELLHVDQWEPYDIHYQLSPIEALQQIMDYMERNHLNVLQADTQIIIAPGYDYKIVKMLITNFHQPQSTLLLLVSAFVNGDWRRIYDYALANDFRFLSYGDSSLLIP
jgi:S-adenosylmethionine:tRNA ribosyltransferase-isomerase